MNVFQNGSITVTSDIVIESQDMLANITDTTNTINTTSPAEKKENHKQDIPTRPYNLCRSYVSQNTAYKPRTTNQSYFKSKNRVPKHRSFRPTCDFFLRGCCKYGENCIYRHDESQKLSQITPLLQGQKYTNTNTNIISQRSNSDSEHSISKHPNKSHNPTTPSSSNSLRKRQKQKKPKVEICDVCGAFFVKTCAFCEDVQKDWSDKSSEKSSDNL